MSAVYNSYRSIIYFKNA